MATPKLSAAGPSTLLHSPSQQQNRHRLQQPGLSAAVVCACVVSDCDCAVVLTVQLLKLLLAKASTGAVALLAAHRWKATQRVYLPM